VNLDKAVTLISEQMKYCTTLQCYNLTLCEICLDDTSISFPAAVHDKVMVQIKDVDSLRPREIAVYWVGMAEVNICL
jgi:hypothetical protein